MSRATDIVELVTYDQWDLESREINNAVNKASDELNKAFKKMPSGGLSDEVRATPKFKKLKQAYNIAFKKLQDFNKKSSKAFQKKQKMEKRKPWRN